MPEGRSRMSADELIVGLVKSGYDVEGAAIVVTDEKSYAIVSVTIYGRDRAREFELEFPLQSAIVHEVNR